VTTNDQKRKNFGKIVSGMFDLESKGVASATKTSVAPSASNAAEAVDQKFLI
jgi:hypothetical protein